MQDYRNFRVLNFRVQIFSWSRIPTEIFDDIKSILYIPRFSNICNETTHAPRTRGVRITCCVRGRIVATMQLLANYIFAWSREPKNAVGMYCGSKDRRFIGH